MINIDCLKKLNLDSIVEIKIAGQKIVYKANSPEYGNVAVKIIKPNQNMKRILREIEIVKNLPGVKTSNIYEDGIITCGEQEYLYIIENFINGENLRDTLELNKKFTFEEVCKFLRIMLNNIAILEENKIVHRDIKPENIMIEKDEFILIDFGIARDLSRTSLTNTSSPRGPATLVYAPIEQIDNEKENIDSRTNLYSVCVVAYEMLCGSNPFFEGCENELQVIRKIDKGEFKYLENKYFKDMLEFIHTNMNRHRTRRSNTAKEAKEWFEEIYSSLCKEL